MEAFIKALAAALESEFAGMIRAAEPDAWKKAAHGIAEKMGVFEQTYAPRKGANYTAYRLGNR